MSAFSDLDDIQSGDPLDNAEQLQNGLVAHATGGGFDGGNYAYKEYRRFFLERADAKQKLPSFVWRCRDLEQFWGWVKFEKGTYAERRNLIWDAFRPLIEYLEDRERTPATETIGDRLQSFDAESVHAVWQKALDRRSNDPAGAITAARTLLETVCKHILDDASVEYAGNADLPKLWSLTAEQMNLSPSQHDEKAFKAILGNCQSIVNYLGTIRNRVGDAHGTGRKPAKPNARHAELVVNLAGTMAAFLVSTWEERSSRAM